MPETPNEKLRPTPEPPVIEEVEPGPPYAELDVVTNFSFLRGASYADELIYRAAALGHRAIAITDVNTLAGIVRAHDAIRQLKGQCETPPKLIIGSRLIFREGLELLVWVTNRAAYARLCRLLTTGKRRTEKGECDLSIDDFLNHNEGMLAAALSPHDRLADLRDCLGNRLSLAAPLLYGNDDESHMNRLLDLSRQFNIPLLATNHVHYHDPSRRPLQDVLTCVRHGGTMTEAGFKLFPNAERYLKSPAQMHRLFVDYPKAIFRTMEIADQCTFSLDELRYEYPDEIVPAGMNITQYLAQLSWEGAHERYPQNIPEKVRNQIARELVLIERLKFEAYFLTVHDLVRFARSRGILCQGRGSAANSAVCYCLGVTSVDPAKIDVLFERFISAARNEPPDIDIDFEHERREEVIQYLYEKYGRERAGMTAEVITYRGRSAVRDVGKALGLSQDMVDEMAKKLDWWHRGTLTAEQIRECGLDPNDPNIRKVISLTKELLGFPRHLSQHVGGMVMTRGPLCELVPIENASMPDRTVIEWDKDDIDSLGILKVDALALGMLTCISKGFALLNGPTVTRASSPCTEPPANKNLPSRLELHTVPPDDPAVYDMICDADTIGVFQIESRAQMTMLPRLRPRNFYDLVIEVAIVRPGPIQGNMVHPYLRRRNGEEAVTYPSENLREVLQKTLGVPLFQEQAMKLAMVGAGFSAEEADRLRRAMAAWKKNGALEQFHPKIINGMLGNGYTREFAQQCFEQIKGFGEYGFPESHAASFALLVYVSAWLKRHHPAAFGCALLNSLPMGFYAPAQIVGDAVNHGVEVRNIDVNHSDWDCLLENPTVTRASSPCSEPSELKVSDIPRNSARAGSPCYDHIFSIPKEEWGRDGPAIRLGFRQIKGLREMHALKIMGARKSVKQFSSITHFHRITQLPRHVIQRLAEADAFGSMKLTRRKALWEVMELSDEQLPLFDHSDVSIHNSEFSSEILPIMPLGQEVMSDYATTSLSLKTHPVALIREKLTTMRILTAKEIIALPNGRWVKAAGVVLIRQRPGTASGIVFETLEDETGIVNLIIRPDIYDRYRPAARHASLVQADGYVERNGQVVHIMAKRLFDLSHLLAGYTLQSRDFH